MHELKAAGSEIINQMSVASNIALQCSRYIAQRTESPLFILSQFKRS